VVATRAAELTRSGQAFVELRLAEEAREAGVALTAEAVDLVDACAAMTRRGLTVVDVEFALLAGEAFGT
jgi:hypothetical protein